MDVSGLNCLDLAPHRVGANRRVKAAVDRQYHIGLPGEDLFWGNIDNRARRGLLARDIAGADEVDDLAADRTGDRRLETVWSACHVNAWPLFERNRRRRLLDLGEHSFGVARERFRTL